jgi:hypothetical protein
MAGSAVLVTLAALMLLVLLVLLVVSQRAPPVMVTVPALPGVLLVVLEGSLPMPGPEVPFDSPFLGESAGAMLPAQLLSPPCCTVDLPF